MIIIKMINQMRFFAGSEHPNNSTVAGICPSRLLVSDLWLRRMVSNSQKLKMSLYSLCLL